MASPLSGGPRRRTVRNADPAMRRTISETDIAQPKNTDVVLGTPIRGRVPVTLHGDSGPLLTPLVAGRGPSKRQKGIGVGALSASIPAHKPATR